MLVVTAIGGAPFFAWGEEATPPGEEATEAPERQAPERQAPERQASIRDGPRAQAQMHFLQGIRLAERQQWEAALAEFDESLRLYPTRSALFNRAISLQHLNRYSEAVAALEEVLSRYASELTEARRRQVRQGLDDLRSLLTAVSIEANVEGAMVSVDGNEVGTTPLERPLLLLSGLHVIELRRRGYRPAYREVAVVSGEQMTERFTLIEPPRMGGIRIEANVTRGEVLIDGLEVGSLPYRGVLAEGLHEVEVSAPGYRAATQMVSVAADEDRSISVTLDRLRRVRRAWFYSLLAVSVAGVLATGGLGAATLVLNASYDAHAIDAQDRQDQGNNLVLATDIALGLSCTMALSTLIIGLFTDWTRPAAEPQRAQELEIPEFETGNNGMEIQEDEP